MDFHISLDGRGDLTARIYGALRDAIRDGHLRPGDRLPPTRDLAKSLTVSRNTVAGASRPQPGCTHGPVGRSSR